MKPRCFPMLLVALAATAVLPTDSYGDPCGMVPPIYTGPGTPIARTGDQNTFVFFKDGVETFVIHPGFQGKVDEFGMLIPFPAVPELRKVSDNIFPHLRAAIDPPEVLVYAYANRRNLFFAKNGQKANAAASGMASGGMLGKKQLRVVKEEAVGMYEVAVLEAGSAKALKKWMDDHGYKYPKGMDAACEDYVKIGWCFVAVKTKVGTKKGADPKPGQRRIKNAMPKGGSFDGHVQAMGFRFKTPKLVVPMRLSTFNEGDLHNIVYVMTDKPVKIRSVPEEYVVRQVSGSELYGNVTNPLPLRVIGGTIKQIGKWQMKNLPQRRNPVPHNGAARDLFATDLLAVKTGQLSHPHEEKEKMLLRIGERLKLRGPDIDKLNEGALADKREKIVAKALADVKGMTLSVIDGNFPREVLANQNLTFANYRMPARRNSSRFYDANTKKPAVINRNGTRFEGKVSLNDDRSTEADNKVSQHTNRPYGVAGLALVAIGCVLAFRRKWNGKFLGLLIAGAAITTILATPSAAVAQGKKATAKDILALIDDLKEPKKATAAAEKLIKIGQPAVPHLIGEAIEGSDLSLRGWAIVCMAEIGGDKAKARLVEIQNDKKQPQLVRTWAAAGRVKLATTSKELIALAGHINEFPALKRPIGLKLMAKLQEKGKKVTTEELLTVSMQVRSLQQVLAPVILNQGADKLVKVMTTSTNQNNRRQAAAYLASLAQRGEDAVPSAVNKAYKFDAKAKNVPWNGGPLFIPGIRWKKDDATTLCRNLVSWIVWVEENAPANQRSGLQRQLHNNMRSFTLARIVGYRSPGFGRQATPERWLQVWGQAKGKKEVQAILASMGVEKKARWAKVLEGLK